MSNLYITGGGGAGDFIYHYFKNDDWACLPTMKHYYNDCHITFVAMFHDPSTIELVTNNPNIDSILVYPWYPPGHNKEKAWKGLIRGSCFSQWRKDHNILPARNHKLIHQVHLTDNESNMMDNIQNDGPYVVQHLFAGLPHRGAFPHPYDGKYKCYPDYKYLESANQLAEKGYKVYLVGRTNFSGADKLRCLVTEELVLPPTAHPNIVNLINKVSFRFNVELVRRAKGFMGSHSSMLSAAWTASVPSVFFYPGYDEHGNKRSVVEHGGTTGTWALDQPQNTYFEMSANDFLNLDSRIPTEALLQRMR